MDEKPFETLNVIPLVDVMLVLLTMVLTTASFISTGRIPVALPQASRQQPEKQADRTISLTDGGGLYLDDQPVDMDVFEDRLAALPADTSFLVRADRSIAFQKFIDVADALKRHHFTKVAVQTQGTAPR